MSTSTEIILLIGGILLIVSVLVYENGISLKGVVTFVLITGVLFFTNPGLEKHKDVFQREVLSRYPKNIVTSVLKRSVTVKDYHILSYTMYKNYDDFYILHYKEYKVGFGILGQVFIFDNIKDHYREQLLAR